MTLGKLGMVLWLLMQGAAPPTAPTTPTSTASPSGTAPSTPPGGLQSMFPTAGIPGGSSPTLPLPSQTGPKSPTSTSEHVDKKSDTVKPTDSAPAVEDVPPQPLPAGAAVPPPALPPAKVPERFQPGDIIWPAVGLVALLIAGAMLFTAFKRWREREAKSGYSIHAELMAYREARDAGDMTEEEYQKVFEKLSGKIKQQGGVAASEGPSSPPPSPPAGS